MTIPTLAFFNNKGGVGKTSLVYHLAWKYADMGMRVLAVDLDPQANLTAAFLDDDAIESLWTQEDTAKTIYDGLRPQIRGTGDIAEVNLVEPHFQIGLLPGDLRLSSFEDELSQVWPKCLSGDERAFRVTTAFWRMMQDSARRQQAGLILIDLGPNLGAINRAALISSDNVVIPLGPDLYSLQGLRNLGPTLRTWRKDWQDRLVRKPPEIGHLPDGKIAPVGYVVMQHSIRLDRPVKSYDRWIARIPETYQNAVLDSTLPVTEDVRQDSNCLSLLKHYRSLMPMAQESRKPMFHLKSADGAIGAHQAAAVEAGRDFRTLANRILQGMDFKPAAEQTARAK